MYSPFGYSSYTNSVEIEISQPAQHKKSAAGDTAEGDGYSPLN
jgi:hypothetical protein